MAQVSSHCELESEAPKLLFISNEVPHNAAAGSIVLAWLLEDYPTDNLFVITNQAPPSQALLLKCPYVTIDLPLDRLGQTRFARHRSAARVLGATKFTSTKGIDRVIGSFKPDIIVTVMQDSWCYDLAAKYAQQHGIPLLLIVMDLAHGFEPVPRWLEKRQLNRDKLIFQQAAGRMLISPGMNEFCEATFGVSGTVLLPGPRASDLPSQPVENCRELKHPGRLTIGYAGGLHYGYGEQIKAMLPVLREQGIMMEICSPLPSGSLASLVENSDVLNFLGYQSPPNRAWTLLLEKCDVVLQPYLNPPLNHELQYRTHFPSKLAGCLSLGLPVLITGPSYASGTRWCIEHPGCACVVDTDEPDALSKTLLRLRDDHDWRVSLASRGKLAAAEFDTGRHVTAFRQLLQETRSSKK